MTLRIRVGAGFSGDANEPATVRRHLPGPGAPRFVLTGTPAGVTRSRLPDAKDKTPGIQLLDLDPAPDERTDR